VPRAEVFKIAAGNMVSFFHLSDTSMGKKVLSGATTV